MAFVNKTSITIGLPFSMANWLRKQHKDTGIPIGRLIEDAVREKYGKEIELLEQELKQEDLS